MKEHIQSLIKTKLEAGLADKLKKKGRTITNDQVITYVDVFETFLKAHGVKDHMRLLELSPSLTEELVENLVRALDKIPNPETFLFSPSKTAHTLDEILKMNDTASQYKDSVAGALSFGGERNML